MSLVALLIYYQLLVPLGKLHGVVLMLEWSIVGMHLIVVLLLTQMVRRRIQRLVGVLRSKRGLVATVEVSSVVVRRVVVGHRLLLAWLLRVLVVAIHHVAST